MAHLPEDRPLPLAQPPHLIAPSIEIIPTRPYFVVDNTLSGAGSDPTLNHYRAQLTQLLHPAQWDKIAQIHKLQKERDGLAQEAAYLRTTIESWSTALAASHEERLLLSQLVVSLTEEVQALRSQEHGVGINSQYGSLRLNMLAAKDRQICVLRRKISKYEVAAQSKNESELQDRSET